MSGPIAPSTLDPPRLDKTTFAAIVAAPILTISFLLDLKAELNVSIPPLRSPFKNDCAAVPALLASKKASPAPVYNRFTENERFALLRGVFLLAAMFVPV
mgnify:CR=1 FL=1